MLLCGIRVHEKAIGQQVSGLILRRGICDPRPLIETVPHASGETPLLHSIIDSACGIGIALAPVLPCEASRFWIEEAPLESQ
jgi:hypothetical protein